MELFIKILIYTHAVFGGIALLSGLISIISNKGKNYHKKSGKIFYYSMLVSILLSLIVSSLPQKENILLFFIGIFSLYFLLSGYRALKYKNQSVNFKIDKLIAIFLIAVCLVTLVLFLNIIRQNSNAIVPIVFSVIGLIFGARDLISLKNPQKLKRVWVKLHLGKITGSYIAAVSAFLVVNNFLPNLLNWFLPTAIGSVYITYWMFKFKNVK